ncbi:hypothetical protein [Parapedobacter tibetensis]|uniref:hypothetical protein n=1 Tax=Parapedobacter tibetensis TaxID=2972951 RepID=UPI00214DE5AC|nr:hypothetical protein [Parapedobacter tibetensis]
MELNLNIIGFLLIALSLVHLIFPKYFDWKVDLSGISLINRQMLYIHTLFIALIVGLIGLLCITSAREIIETSLGHKLALGIGMFWAIRLLVQFFGYSAKLWKGKAFETIIHVLFSMLWLYLSAVFLTIFWMGWKGQMYCL